LSVLFKTVFLSENKEKMIQRIQTVYILLSAILIGLLFSLPFAEIVFNNQLYLFDIRGIVKNDTIQENGLPIALFITLILLLHVFTVFIYKKRRLQIRILIFSILLMLGLFGLFYFFAYNSFDDAQVSFKIAVAFPLIAIILDYLAIRNIGKDEALIRSIDRIR
jgi:D-alanyl-lipoteichoic acid acyltransferase DltB (MBOAT superfamily)